MSTTPRPTTPVRGRRHLAPAALAVTGVAALALAAAVPASGADAPVLLRSGVVGSLPTDVTIAAHAPGGRPWIVGRSVVEVSRTGHLRAKVRHLVIPDGTGGGTNPVPALGAALVCGDAVVATTATVTFTAAGNATIDAQVAVPDRCLAPAVLLTPNGSPTVYIGVTG